MSRLRFSIFFPLTAAITFGLAAAPAAQAAKYTVAKDSKIEFLAKITASSFTAFSKSVSGTAVFDPKTGKLGPVDIKVKADSFETGMAVRDKKMKKDYLETGKFPEIRFTAKGGKVAAKPKTESTLDGHFTIKGVKKPIKVKVIPSEVGDTIKAEVKFPLDVTDYGIPQPKFTVVKMETVIQVTLHLVLEK